ncbi:MAG: hypothetical protein HY913_13160 [Desulfomonile tiedjei]|nr:hypothetical protein [Desulfomonile tiedjei]
MVMVYETLFLAVAALIAPLFGKHAGYELHRKPFELVGASGLFFMLTAAFGVLPLEGFGLAAVWHFASVVSYFIGWLGLLVGAVWELVDVLRTREAHEHV